MEEREAFRVEREQADAALRVERREAAAAQERLRAETENLRANMEQLQRRNEGQSCFARGEPFAGLGSVGGLEGRLPARRATGSGFVPAGFQSPRSSVSGDVVLHQLQELVTIRFRVTSPSRSRMCHFSTVLRQNLLSSNEI